MAEHLLRVEGLTVDLPTEDGFVRVVDDVSFAVDSGEFVGLAGESGSGKTITSLSIMRLLPFRRTRVTGTVEFCGTELLALRRAEMTRFRGAELAMVFQEPMTSLHPAWPVGRQIAEVLRAHEPVSRRDAARRAVEMLDVVGISEPARRAEQYPHELSGGMQQRVMIALALVCRPKLLIADEPTTALDVTVQAQIVELLRRLQAELDMAVLFVTHDLGLLAELCDRMLVMYAGQIVEDAATEDVLVRPRHPYTQALLLAAPHPSLKGQRLPTIQGAPPQPGRFATGCRFHARCAYATPACEESPPALRTLEPGARARCLLADDLDLAQAMERVR